MALIKVGLLVLVVLATAGLSEGVFDSLSVTWRRTSCTSFSTGSARCSARVGFIPSEDASKPVPTCCAGGKCVALQGLQVASLSDCLKAGPQFDSVACCPDDLSGQRAFMWNREGCPGQRTKWSPRAPSCPKDSLWACCTGSGRDESCIRVTDLDRTGCLDTSATYGCCPN